MKTILLILLLLFILGDCKSQKLDSTDINKMLVGKWVDSNFIPSTKYSSSRHIYITMSVSGDSILFNEDTDMDIEGDNRPFKYEVSKQTCFRGSDNIPNKGTGYFLKLVHSYSYPEDREANYCYYIEVINENQLVLQPSAGRNGEEIYKRVK